MGDVILDSSALLAILKKEPDASTIADAATDADRLLLCTLNYMETGIVWDNDVSGARNPHEFAQLLAELDVKMIPVSFDFADTARAAYRRFGKGKHPAKLNMGDCFAYALAKKLDVPLLYKGVDFDKTDVKSAL